MRIHKQANMLFWGVQAPLACATLVIGILALKGQQDIMVHKWLVSGPMIWICFGFTASTLAMLAFFEWMKDDGAKREAISDAVIAAFLLLASLASFIFLLAMWNTWIAIRHFTGIERQLPPRRQR